MNDAPTKRIAALLKGVTAAMRTLLKETATDGNSDHLRRIAGWIADVEELTGRVYPNATALSVTTVETTVAERRQPVGLPKKQFGSRREPRFERAGETLVKIAWSKKNRAEYEHKASRAALTSVVERVEREGRGRKTFRMEAVLPVCLPDGTEIPSYQAYLCVGWLKSSGLLEQHGRQGYTIPPDVTISREIERAWAQLPARGE